MQPVVVLLLFVVASAEGEAMKQALLLCHLHLQRRRPARPVLGGGDGLIAPLGRLQGRRPVSQLRCAMRLLRIA